MKRLTMYVLLLVLLFSLGGCLYVFSIPIPIVEGLIEPITFNLPGVPVPLVGYSNGEQTIPSLSEIIAEAQKHSPIDLPNNFRITGVEIKAKVFWDVGIADPIDLRFYISRDLFSDIPSLITDPVTIGDKELFNDEIEPGENMFSAKSDDLPALSTILDILNGGTSEDIFWLAVYNYNSSEDSTVTVYLSGTVWVKRVME